MLSALVFSKKEATTNMCFFFFSVSYSLVFWGFLLAGTKKLAKTIVISFTLELSFPVIRRRQLHISGN